MGGGGRRERRGRGTAGSGAGRRGGGGGGGLEISTRGGGGQRLIPLAAPSRSRAEPEQRGHRCPGRRAGDALPPPPPLRAPSCSAPGVRPGAPSRLSVASAEEGGGGDVAAHPRGREPDGFVPLGEGGAVSLRRFVRRRRRCPPGRAPVRPPRPGPGSQLPRPWHCPSAPSLLRHPRAAGSFSFSSRTIYKSSEASCF